MRPTASPTLPVRKARSAVYPAPAVHHAPRLKTRSATTASTNAISLRLETSVQAPVCKRAAAALLQHLDARVWCEALRTVSLVLKNASVCIACAWATNWTLSLGNVLSGKPPREQGDGEFLFAAALANYFSFYFVMIATHTAVLRSFPYANKPPEYRPPFWLCSGRLLHMTSSVFATSLVLFIAQGYAIQAAPLHVRKNHLGFYAIGPCVHLYTTAITTAVRRIYRRDSVAGQARSNAQPAWSRWRSCCNFWKVYAATLPKALIVASAGLYVQLVSQVEIASTVDFALYSASNLALKFVVTTISKLMIIRFKIKDVRTIFVIAGLPTVLINTQVRVMLQRVQSTKYTLAWTVGMAVLEIGTRVANVLLTKRAVKRKKREMRIATLGLIPASALALVPARVAASRDRGRVDTVSSFHVWRRQILAFQVAEVVANMAAEYIAIGCSASILYFYSGHPKYILSPSPDAVDLDRGDSASQVSTIAIQVAVEVVVDVVASAFEISEGVDFAHHVYKYYDFIALFFVSIAVLNIIVSSLIYYDPR